MLGDRLFLDRKLFKFSFSSDALGGTQSTHVEPKSHGDLVINDHMSWCSQAQREILSILGEECGMWSLQNHGVGGGEGAPSGTIWRHGSYFLPHWTVALEPPGSLT